jgi:hypothetical protein
MWLILLVLILIVLAVAFGGFQKGTKTGGLPARPAPMIAAMHPHYSTVSIRRPS